MAAGVHVAGKIETGTAKPLNTYGQNGKNERSE